MCNRHRMTAKQLDVARALSVGLPFVDDVTLPPPKLFPKKRRGSRATTTARGGSMSWPRALRTSTPVPAGRHLTSR